MACCLKRSRKVHNNESSRTRDTKCSHHELQELPTIYTMYDGFNSSPLQSLCLMLHQQHCSLLQDLERLSETSRHSLFHILQIKYFYKRNQDLLRLPINHSTRLAS